MDMMNNLPKELRAKGLFCLWKYEPDEKGNPTKVPYNPNKPGRKASSTDTECFSSFDKAVRLVNDYSGLGTGMFRGLFSKGELCGIDIDHCIDDQGNLSDKAQKIVNRLKWCYWEKSPSGHGLRGFGLVNSDFKYDRDTYYFKRGDLEIYVAGTTARFLTVTGNVYKPGELTDITHELLDVMQTYMKRGKEVIASSEAKPTGLADDVILQKAAAASNGDKFMQLWSGDTSGYPSESEADLALCNMLAFWTGKDAARIDQLFRQSGLMRDKWDQRRGGSTYGADTIIKAVNACTDTYSPKKSSSSLEPDDYSDLGQAEVMVREYGHKLRYSTATKYLVYDGKVWEENELRARELSQELTNRQLKEARKRLQKSRAVLDDLIEADADIKAATEAVRREESYRKYVIARRSTTKITATMTEAAPMVRIGVSSLDGDGYLLNTPSGTVDLRSGQIRQHDPKDYCTKITTVAPDQAGADVWREFLDQLTVGDKDLQMYLQNIAGVCAIGTVKREELIIATGSGGNGKSTFFNLMFHVLGDYAGMLSAETLTKDSRKNKSPEYAELRGKRMIISAELEEGARLDTSTVKKLCSTDPIIAEKKYKDPFVFIPSHSCILYTNHLPKVSASDNGTWSRLVVVPFKALFRGKSGEVKKYEDVLYNQCGGAVLSWIIEGAKRVIEDNFFIQQPECVREAIAEYRDNSNEISMFIDDRCVVDRKAITPAGKLYEEYRSYCQDEGIYVKDKAHFRQALDDLGYEWKRITAGRVHRGIRLKTAFEIHAV